MSVFSDSLDKLLMRIDDINDGIKATLDLLSKATEFDFGQYPGYPPHWTNHVKVSQRSPGSWAVEVGGNVWEDTEDYRGFIVESQLASSRTDAFIAATRFPLARAVQIATALVDGTLKSPHEDAVYRHRDEPEGEAS